MIHYNYGYFNITCLFQVHGSATYKAISLACLSSAVYLLFISLDGYWDNEVVDYNLLEHPYPITVICTVLMYVLSSKVNFCYQRYWEACQALHNMHSKWLTLGSTMAAFHMQSKTYEHVQPLSFGDHQHLNDLVLQRDREKDRAANVQTEEYATMDDDRFSNDAANIGTTNHNMNFVGFMNRMRNKRRKNKERQKAVEFLVTINSSSSRNELPFPEYNMTSSPRKRSVKGESTSKELGVPNLGTLTSITDKSRTGITPTTTPLTEISGAESSTRMDQERPAVPSLFLQEGAHLISLLSAVALSGLRCESEYSGAPLTKFSPGNHWPDFNSDNDPDMKRYGYQSNGFVTTIKYMIDISRTAHEGSAYNDARPFPVIGGVSDREASLLQKARGPFAKTALAFMWLNEFIIREQQHGSLGATAPPIVSRLQQYSSDGHMFYNAARKMSYIPFPFPITQMTTLLVIACIFFLPILMISKAEVWFGFALNFLTVTLFAGLNEVAKELEFPFRSMPNDLPLNLFQAQFNEALVTMFSGFHPDA